MLLSLFSVVFNCWICSLPLIKSSFVPQETPSEKTKFVFATRDCFCIQDRGMCAHLSVLGPHLLQTFACLHILPQFLEFICTLFLVDLEGLAFIGNTDLCSTLTSYFRCFLGQRSLQRWGLFS